MYTEPATQVVIKADEINCYATIQRSMLTAINAALKVNANAHVEHMLNMKHWAQEKYESLIHQKID